MGVTLSHMVLGCDGLQRRFVVCEGVVRAADGMAAKGTGRRAPPGRSSLTLAVGLRPSMASDLLATALRSHPVHHPHSSSRDEGRSEAARTHDRAAWRGVVRARAVASRPQRRMRGGRPRASGRSGQEGRDERCPRAHGPSPRRDALARSVGPHARRHRTNEGSHRNGKRRAAPVRPCSAPCWHLSVTAAGTTPPGTASGRLRGACVAASGNLLGAIPYFLSSSRRRSSRSSCFS
ncbi:MAG: hypothetical protein RL760_241 [Candidatus Eisenbacteria bacterium]